MPVLTNKRADQPWYRRLFLPAYRIGEAARYVGAHSSTVSSWHYGNNPLLPGHDAKKALNYLELVEVAFVAFFRQMGVPMHRIRKAREYIQQNMTAEYPLAEYQFKTEGMRILMDYDQFDHDPNMARIIVASDSGQLAWSELIADRFAAFEYEYDLAMRWHPAGPESKVIIDPRISFGAPIISGLPTWVIKGRYIAKESPEEIAEEFGLPLDDVIEALHFEESRTAVA